VLERLRLDADAFVIGMFARYDPMKDHANLLEAAARFAREEPRAHWLLAGEGITAANRALTERIDALQLAGRVSLLGRSDRVPELVAGLDMATLSSRSEAFPNVVIEAMASEVPVVTTDVGDAATIVGDTGIVVPPRNAPALAAGWRELRNRGGAALRDLGRRARERVQHEYSLDAAVARYEALYRQEAGRRDRGGSRGAAK
jgi:glycosyltransferase involved in cell wall biosynthesis